MTDLTKMPVVAAIKWYDAVEDKNYLEPDDLDMLVTNGITDTAEIEEIAGLAVLGDLEKAPDLPVTMANLRLLSVVGPRVMAEDRENAEEWAAVVKHQIDSGGLIDDFLEAGRGPSFARDVVALMDRLDAEDPYSSTSLDDIDLTLPLADIIAMMDARMSDHERGRWEALGIDLPTALRLREDVRIDTAQTLAQVHGITDVDGWKKYASLPTHWVSRKAPEGFTLDVLLDFAERNFATKEQYGVPWAMPMPRSGGYRSANAMTVEIAQMLADAGMQPADAGRYYDESTPARRSVSDAPPALIPWMSHLTVAMTQAWVALWQAGVKPSHLSDYRYGGCHTYAQIMQAVEMGIDHKQVKHLRKVIGVAPHSWSRTRRIYQFEDLVKAHEADQQIERLPKGAGA